MRSEVWCYFELEGLHCWATCPIEEVEYLRSPHRHMFTFKCFWNVSHSDRDIEFIVAKHQVQRYLEEQYWNGRLQLCDFEGRSCEMLGEELILQFNCDRVEVSEDGENGAIIYKD